MDTENLSTPAGLNGHPLRIGTRESPLALWQATLVADFLKDHGLPYALCPIRSQGDLNLDVPLYEMGITGIFTRALDVALLRGEIDVAVHSFKDVPTRLPKGLEVLAVLSRDSPTDLAVCSQEGEFPENAVIGTGSLRRQAQWLRRHPSHRIEDLRGNVQTRIARLHQQAWHAALFASAGLRRMNIHPPHTIELDWMIPAPAQGAIAVVSRRDDMNLYHSVFKELDHRPTRLCVDLERAFLRELEGGCTAPIGAYAYIEEDALHFRAGLYSVDGSEAIEIQHAIPIAEATEVTAELWARSVLERGGAEIMQSLNR